MTCTKCGGKGWYTEQIGLDDVEQVQCDRCYGSGEIGSPKHPAFDYARRDCQDHFTACQIETMSALCAMAEQFGELAYQIKRLADLLEGPTGEATVRVKRDE